MKKLSTALLLSAACLLGFVIGNAHSRNQFLKETIESFAGRQPTFTKESLLIVAGAHNCGADAEILAHLIPWAYQKREQLIRQQLQMLYPPAPAPAPAPVEPPVAPAAAVETKAAEPVEDWDDLFWALPKTGKSRVFNSSGGGLNAIALP